MATQINEVAKRSLSSSDITRKYGLITATCMVVGCIIGSGIFFRTGKVLDASGGSVGVGILAWIVGGLMMMVCAYAFSVLSTRYEKSGGFVDYTEALVGKKFAYFTAWFMATMSGPCTVALVSYVAANYTAVLIKVPADDTSFVFTLAAIYMVFIFAMNTYGPKIAGKFQVSTVGIKLIPLVVVGIAGIFVGIFRGADVKDLAQMFANPATKSATFLGAVFSTAFAYAGWDPVAALNREIKNSKRNLPIALMVGGAIAIGMYCLYFLGVAGAGNGDALIQDNFGGTMTAIEGIFGAAASSILLVFIIISCLGTVNGYTMASTRYMYSLALRDRGPNPAMFKTVDSHSNIAVNGAIFSLLAAFVWLFVTMMVKNQWFGQFNKFDVGDLKVFGLYIFCVPLFFMIMIKEKDLHWIRRFLFPALACGASVLLVIIPAIDNIGLFGIYLGIIVLVVVVGAFIFIKKKTYLEQVVAQQVEQAEDVEETTNEENTI